MLLPFVGHWLSITVPLHLSKCTKCAKLVYVPAGVSLATAGVDTLGQCVVQAGINHIQTDRLLMHLAAGIPKKNTPKKKTHFLGQNTNQLH